MFVEFSIERKKEYWLLSLLASALYVFLGIAMNVDVDDAIRLGLLMLLVLVFRIRFSDKTPGFVGPLIAALFSFIIFYEVQLAVGASINKLSFLLVFAMLLSFAACGADPAPADTSADSDSDSAPADTAADTELSETIRADKYSGNKIRRN